LIVTPAAKKHYEDDEFFFKLGTTEVSVTHQSNATIRTRNSFNTLKSWHRRLAGAREFFDKSFVHSTVETPVPPGFSATLPFGYSDSD